VVSLATVCLPSRSSRRIEKKKDGDCTVGSVERKGEREGKRERRIDRQTVTTDDAWNG